MYCLTFFQVWAFLSFMLCWVYHDFIALSKIKRAHFMFARLIFVCFSMLFIVKGLNLNVEKKLSNFELSLVNRMAVMFCLDRQHWTYIFFSKLLLLMSTSCKHWHAYHIMTSLDLRYGPEKNFQIHSSGVEFLFTYKSYNVWTWIFFCQWSLKTFFKINGFAKSLARLNLTV